MKCEWVEEHLSAYHDRVLDAATTDQVEHHLLGCVNCRAWLVDYERFDNVLATMPREQPRPELRARIFASPEFHEILHERAAVPPPPVKPLVPAVPHPSHRASSSIHVTRALVGVAILMIALASASFVLRSLAAQPTVCPNPAAGDHLLTRAADGSLLLDGQRLTCAPHAVAASPFALSPNGQMVAFVNQAGDVVAMHANGRDAQILRPHTFSAQFTHIDALSWSPGSDALAILTNTGTGVATYQVEIASLATTGSRILDGFTTDALLAAPLWSPDGVFLAYGLTTASGSTIRAVRVNQTDSLPVQFPIAGSLGDLAWLPGTADTLTYTTVSPTLVTSITIAQMSGRVVVEPIYQSPAYLAVAMTDYNPITGAWALTLSDGTVASVETPTGIVTPLAQLDASTKLFWSPDGTTLAAFSQGALWLISSNGAHQVATNVTGKPVWNPRGTALAVVSTGAVRVIKVTGGMVALPFAVGSIAHIAWSADGQHLAILSQDHTFIATAAGTVTATNDPSVGSPIWMVEP